MLFWAFLGLFLVALLVAVIPAWPYSRRWGSRVMLSPDPPHSLRHR